MNYSRANPSTRYLDLLSLYRQMHQTGENFLGVLPENTFPGKSLMPQVGRIKDLIIRTGARTILDYGCGKGQQYGSQKIRDASGQYWPSVIDYWEIDEVVCYDPCYEPYRKLPKGKFDGVISTDVLEHCPEDDVPWIVDEMFGYAIRFVFANVACYPARKRLPNGENAHCTVKPLEWWQELVGAIAARHPGIVWEFWFKLHVETAAGTRAVEKRIGG